MGLTDNNEQVVDIQLVNPKRKFRINGDNSMIIELNISDVNIAVRLKEVYKKLDAMSKKASTLLIDKEDATTEEEVATVSDALVELDKEMRELVDYLFDSDVCSVCAKDMNMYSMVNGEFWFEHVITTLSRLYEANIQSEVDKMNERIHNHTGKYTGK